MFAISVLQTCHPGFPVSGVLHKGAQKRGSTLRALYVKTKQNKGLFFFGAANLKLKPINLLACWVMSWFFVSGSVGLQFDLFFRARLKQQWWEGGCSCFFFELAKVGIHAMF